MTKPRVDAAGFAVVVDPRNSKNDHIVFDVLDTQSGEGGRIVANRRPDGRLSFEVVEIGERTEFKVWKDEPLPFERWEVSPGMTIDDWRALTTVEVIERAGGVKDAWRTNEAAPHAPQNGTEPWLGVIPPLGSIGYDPIGNDFAVLLRLDTREVEAAEPEDGIRASWRYKNYLKWARFGVQPPPMAAWDHVDGGKIRTGGRRRTLAAQEAGRRGLICWFSATAETGRSKWELPEGDPGIEEYRSKSYARARRPTFGQGVAKW